MNEHGILSKAELVLMGYKNENGSFEIAIYFNPFYTEIRFKIVRCLYE